MSDERNSGRKIDLFGTFLESARSMPRTAALGAAPPRMVVAAGAGPDPVNEMLKSLKEGDRFAKELIPLVGNVTQYLAVSDKLVEMGWARRMDGDVLQLTDKGHEVAALL
jgi:hypothetical protein